MNNNGNNVSPIICRHFRCCCCEVEERTKVNQTQFPSIFQPISNLAESFVGFIMKLAKLELPPTRFDLSRFSIVSVPAAWLRLAFSIEWFCAHHRLLFLPNLIEMLFASETTSIMPTGNLESNSHGKHWMAVLTIRNFVSWWFSITAATSTDPAFVEVCVGDWSEWVRSIVLLCCWHTSWIKSWSRS